MSDRKKGVIVQVDDWTALYVDGKMAAQNHSLDLKEIAELAPNGFVIRDVTPEFDQEIIYTRGMPDTLDEFPEEAWA